MSLKKPFRAVPIREGAHYAARKRKRRQKDFIAKMATGLVLTMAVGTGAHFMRDRNAPPPAGESQPIDAASYVAPRLMSAAELDAQQPSAGAPTRAEVRPIPASGSIWSYPNCRAARAAGAAPLYAGQPGYGAHMDGDGDGIACEPYPGRR